MSDDLVKRLRHTLGSVSVGEHMHGDNLAILLCSFYEDAEGEVDDNGWTEVAVTGCERTLEAIHAHYAYHIEALTAALEKADGCANWCDALLEMVRDTSCEPDDPEAFDEVLMGAQMFLDAYRAAREAVK